MKTIYDFKVKTIQGEETTLEQYKGSVLHTEEISLMQSGCSRHKIQEVQDESSTHRCKWVCRYSVTRAL